ncbi:helix-turn-helix domain-containing protein [Rhizobium leguminosarum]|uniref:helix-turn-helix domain-containing protein n=1 Tax=Rhizobium leguminosarum TaxID=384 RepID=UPI001FEF180F|nr:helix-turn-helix domain-containing protein [Rhizobium leguminosarum]
MNKLTKQQAPFTQVPNQLLTDSSITLKAKGLYALMYSKPDNWTFYETALAKECKEGKEAVSAALNELVEAGWLKRSGGRQEGTNRFCAYDYEILATSDGKAVTEKPSREIRDGNPATSNTQPTNIDEENPSVSPKPMKASSRALPAIRLSQFLENTGGLPPCEWGDYPRDEHGWDSNRVTTVWRSFERYWNSPDCRKPLKRDWFGTWQNWCDREAQNGRRGGGAGGTAGGGLSAAIGGFVARGERNGNPNGDAAFSTGGGAGADAGDDGRRYDGTDIPF